MTIPLKHRSDGLGEFEPNDAVPIEHGGTGAKDVETAQQNLGIKDPLETKLTGLAVQPASPIKSEDNILIALEKLQAQINAGNSGSKAEWVDAETIGSFNTATFGHSTIGGKPAKLEFARIDGGLWIRGFLLHKVYDRGQIFTITGKNYKTYSTGTDYAGISTIFAWLSGNSNAITLVSPSQVFDDATAISANQWLNAPNTMAATTFHIPMQCLGKLVL